MPPSGNQLLRIALAAARAAANKTTMQNVSTLLTILMAVMEWWHYIAHIAWWRRFMAFIKATKRCHQASTCSDSIQSVTPTLLGFILCRWSHTVDGLTLDRLHLEVSFRWRYREWIFPLLLSFPVVFTPLFCKWRIDRNKQVKWDFTCYTDLVSQPDRY